MAVVFNESILDYRNLQTPETFATVCKWLGLATPVQP